MPLIIPATQQTPGGHFLGKIKDKHDPRDYVARYGEMVRLMGPEPTKLDVLAGLAMPAKFDQVQQSSCTANAGTRFRDFLTFKFPQFSPAYVHLSRQALYWWERQLSGTTDTDSGAESRDIFRVLTSIGACPEIDDPYSVTNLYRDPGPKALADAMAWKIGAYHRILTLDDLKGCLLSGYAFTMGFAVYESFEAIGRDGIYMPNVDTERIIGMHEVFGHGFDDTINGGSILFDNSWGSSWGADGSFWTPYSFILNYAASQWDAWTGHLGKQWRPSLVH